MRDSHCSVQVWCNENNSASFTMIVSFLFDLNALIKLIVKDFSCTLYPSNELNKPFLLHHQDTLVGI